MTTRAQSRTGSMVEAGVNVAAGYGVAVAAQIMIFPWFGIAATLQDNLAIGAIFTVVSLARSYTVRRLFEGLR